MYKHCFSLLHAAHKQSWNSDELNQQMFKQM